MPFEKIELILTNRSVNVTNCKLKSLEFFNVKYLEVIMNVMFVLPVIVFGLVGHAALALSIKNPTQAIFKPHFKVMLLTYNVFSLLFLLFMIPKIVANKIVNVDIFIVSSYLFGEFYRVMTVSVTGAFAVQRIAEILNIRCIGIHKKKRSMYFVSALLFVDTGFTYFQMAMMSESVACRDNKHLFIFILQNGVWALKTDSMLYRVLIILYQSFFVPLLIFVYFIVVLRLRLSISKLSLAYNTDGPFMYRDLIITDSMRDKANYILFSMFLLLVAPEPVVQMTLFYFLDDLMFIKLQIIVFYLYILNSSLSFIPFIFLFNPLRRNLMKYYSKDYWMKFLRRIIYKDAEKRPLPSVNSS